MTRNRRPNSTSGNSGNSGASWGVINTGMVNQPTAMGANQANGNDSVSDYVTMRIKNNSNVRKKVILFDTLGGYQYHNNTFNDPLVSIQGVSDNYQFTMNWIQKYAAVLTHMKLVVCNAADENCNGNSQFGSPFRVYSTVLGNGPELKKTVYPSKGINEGQFHQNIVTYRFNQTIDAKTAVVFDIGPNVDLQIDWYKIADLERVK